MTSEPARPTEHQLASSGAEVIVEIHDEPDTLLSSRVCYQLGEAIGLGDRALWEISVVVSELASAALARSGGARLHARLLPRPRPGVEVEIRERSPRGETRATARTWLRARDGRGSQ